MGTVHVVTDIYASEGAPTWIGISHSDTLLIDNLPKREVRLLGGDSITLPASCIRVITDREARDLLTGLTFGQWERIKPHWSDQEFWLGPENHLWVAGSVWTLWLDGIRVARGNEEGDEAHAKACAAREVLRRMCDGTL